MKREAITKLTGAGGETTRNYCVIKSPIGELLLVADDCALSGLYFVDEDQVPSPAKHWKLNARYPVLHEAQQQLREYFAREREGFSLPLRLSGTDFQQSVWREIARIPYGETISYSDLAKRAGAPRAVRAAGTAASRNPVAIIVPCHRVVGKNGDLCGFAGGLKKKRLLLGIETENPVSGLSTAGEPRYSEPKPALTT